MPHVSTPDPRLPNFGCRTSLSLSAAVLILLAAGCSRPIPVEEIRAAETASRASAAPLSKPAEDDWPAWRGPNGTGAQPNADPPVVWNATTNVVWKSPVPGRGHSSPIIRGDKVFLATADEKHQSLLCFDRTSGKELWNTPVHSGGFDHAHEKNTQASPTPACDGDKVFITFLNKKAIWLSALDLAGKVLWQREVGPFNTVHGYAASPALYENLVIVVGDSNLSAFIAGVDRSSGEILWRKQRKQKTSFSSPIVARVAGRDQVVTMGASAIISYDPKTGDTLWTYSGGPSETTSGTIAFDDDRIYASGGYPGNQTLCLKADGSGDVTQTHLVWKNDQKFYVPSLLVHDGRLYAVSDNGVAHCYEAATGKELWVRRLKGDFSSSPTLAGNHIYVTSEPGRTFVLKPGDKYQLLAENDLGDGGMASPAVSGKQLFFRTDHHLFCIGE